MLRLQVGEHILANILDNHPKIPEYAVAISLLHLDLGSFWTLSERESRPKQEKRLVLLKHKRNFILPAPHLACVSVYRRPRLKIKHKNSTKEKAHTHTNAVEKEISNTVGVPNTHIYKRNNKQGCKYHKHVGQSCKN